MSVLVRYQEVGMARQQYDDAGSLLEQGEFRLRDLSFMPCSARRAVSG